MFVKSKFLPNSNVLLHVQLCVRPLWSADRPEPEYQQIQSRGELATWLQHNFSSKKQESTKICLVAGGGSDGSDVPGHRLDLLGRLLLLPHTGFHPGNKLFTIIHYHSLLFSLSQRRKFLDDRGYWTVLPWFFHTEKAEINISALILKDYPHSTVNLRPLALSRLTKDRE